jgi:hypothetical protein
LWTLCLALECSAKPEIGDLLDAAQRRRIASATAVGSTRYSPFSICSLTLAAFISDPSAGL